MEVKKLILIIDDEPDFVETMRIFLENYDFRAISSLDYEKGIELAQKVLPDLILLDLNLPKKSGHEVLKQIKENPNIRHIPVIMLTCQDATIDKVEAFNLGAADYICKTSSFEEIIARIKAKLLHLNSGIKEKRAEKIIELRKIIDNKNLRIFFQPIVKLIDKSILGYEVFTRGPEGSVFEDASTLFSFATEESMFLELETRAISLAIEKAKFLLPQQYIFLNVDLLFLDVPQFKELSFLKNSNIQSSQLCLEITERTFIKNFTKLSNLLDDFHKKGIKIAIDDVGEGYSSLKAIVELKPQFIKIDIDIVRNVHQDHTKATLIELIVELAKKINILTIAEGIETEEETKTLISLGVDFGQGYLLGRPQQY
ncbi:MAG: EAL domain-containing response regulator [Candidatus Omnitrophica bacterium]|nr:EAL domain-containing response regulator [Candidatus Omnitrophota bacterium]